MQRKPKQLPLPFRSGQSWRSACGSTKRLFHLVPADPPSTLRAACGVAIHEPSLTDSPAGFPRKFCSRCLESCCGIRKPRRRPLLPPWNKKGCWSTGRTLTTRVPPVQTLKTEASGEEFTP